MRILEIHKKPSWKISEKSTKSNLKRKIKAIRGLELEWANTLQEANNIFAELIELHQARWNSAGLPGAFHSSRFLNFQKSLITKLFDRNQVVLFRVKDQKATIGCLLLLVDQNRLLDYVSGFAPFEKGTSPGLVTHYLCMEEALKRGYDAYDFLVGDKRHKENLGKSETTLTWYTLRRKTWKHFAINSLRKIKNLISSLLSKQQQKGETA